MHALSPFQDPSSLTLSSSLSTSNSLKTYPNSIGITHYLVNRLRSFEYEDVEFYWPQLWCVAFLSSTFRLSGLTFSFVPATS